MLTINEKRAEVMRNLLSDIRSSRLECAKLRKQKGELMALLEQMPAILISGSIQDRSQASSLINFTLEEIGSDK